MRARSEDDLIREYCQMIRAALNRTKLTETVEPPEIERELDRDPLLVALVSIASNLGFRSYTGEGPLFEKGHVLTSTAVMLGLRDHQLVARLVESAGNGKTKELAQCVSQLISEYRGRQPT